ncbi:MAG TPA: VWA domain-containing protein, partial [Thermoanaerobaculia bacterium]
MLRTSASVLLAVLLAAALRAQNPDSGVPDGAEPVQETAEAVLVEVPVRVLDRNGKPVPGLEAKDFEIFDDGKKQEILAVDAIDLARKAVSPAEPGPLHPAARRHFLLLFDFSFAHPKSILGAQRAAREFVMNGVAETDLVAVATYSVEYGLKLLVTFSGDRVQVSRAIDTLGLLATEDVTTRDPLAFAFDIAKVSPVSSAIGLKESNAAAITETLQTMLQLSRARWDEYLRQRVRRLTESLQDLASTLDSVSGRKDVVYLSEGFQSRFVSGTKDTDQERDWILSGEYWKVDGEKRYGNTTLQNDLRKVGEVFRRSDCVMHAVDIAGLRMDPETTSVDQPSENSLFELAEPTGGEVFRNSNDFREHFARMMTSTSLVYVLSFRPERTGQEGKFHGLKVKAKVPGARVLARAGYYEKPAFRLLSPLERSLVAADVIANEIPLAEIPTRLRVSPLPDESGPAKVPVLIEVPAAGLLTGQGEQRLAAEIYVYAHDEQGQLRDFFTQTV